MKKVGLVQMIPRGVILKIYLHSWNYSKAFSNKTIKTYLKYKMAMLKY